LGKELEAENKVVVAKLASPAPAEMKEALQMSSMEGSISQASSTPPSPSSPRKYGRLLSPETRRCHPVFFRIWLPLAPVN
jgi:hypothetical protein